MFGLIYPALHHGCYYTLQNVYAVRFSSIEILSTGEYLWAYDTFVVKISALLFVGRHLALTSVCV